MFQPSKGTFLAAAVGLAVMAAVGLPAAFCVQSSKSHPGLGNIGGPSQGISSPRLRGGVSQVADKVSIANLGMALAAGALLASAARARSRTTMYGDNRNFMTPNKKGMKPILHRLVSRDWHLRQLAKSKEKFPTLQSMEKWFTTSAYKKVKFNFSTDLMTDEIPWLNSPSYRYGGQAARGAEDSTEDHDKDNALYRRKFLEPTNFKKMEITKWEMPDNYTPQVGLKELVDCGAQFGHNAGAWNQRMYKYIYSDMDGTHIFDLVQTAAGVNRACYYLKEAASKGAQILLLGTKEAAAEAIREVGERTGQPYCDKKVVGGLISNFDVISEQRFKMEKLLEEQKLDMWATFGKDEIAKNLEDLDHLMERYGGLRPMKDLPHICILVDEMAERKTVLELKGIGIPIIGLLDSNSNPEFVDIVIPCNTTSKQCVDLILGKLGDAIAAGKQQWDETAVGDRPKFAPQWDPWAFSKHTVLRQLRRKQKRQAWMKTLYGSYENWKAAHPFRHMPAMVEFKQFEWDEQ